MMYGSEEEKESRHPVRILTIIFLYILYSLDAYLTFTYRLHYNTFFIRHLVTHSGALLGAELCLDLGKIVSVRRI